MHKECRKWIVGILKNHSEILKLALRQRAKFEGWLKFELASYIVKNISKTVRVESAYADNKNRSRSDIYFKCGNKDYYLELKTPNTNWKINGIENRTRPITKNIDSIISDGEKIRKYGKEGIVGFVLFPIPVGGKHCNDWEKHIKRISAGLGINLSKEEHWDEIEINEKEMKCKIIVCCFSMK